MAAQPVPSTPTASTIAACAASMQSYLQQLLSAGPASIGGGDNAALLCSLCVDLAKMCGYINGLAGAPTGGDKTAAVNLQTQANLLAAALGGQFAP